MSIFLQVAVNSMPLLFCVGTGLLLYRRIHTPFRFLVLQAIGALVITLWGIYVSRFTDRPNNQVYFNFYIPFDFVLTLLAAQRHFGRHFRQFALISIVIFALASVVSCAVLGIHVLATQVISLYAIILTIAFFMVLLRTSQQPGSRATTGIYIISVSIMLYYCCIIPTFGLIHYIIARDVHLASRLFDINEILSSVRYIFTAIGFILIADRAPSVLHADK